MWSKIFSCYFYVTRTYMPQKLFLKKINQGCWVAATLSIIIYNIYLCFSYKILHIAVVYQYYTLLQYGLSFFSYNINFRYIYFYICKIISYRRKNKFSLYLFGCHILIVYFRTDIYVEIKNHHYMRCKYTRMLLLVDE